jgi:hypothetical protein
MPSRHAAHSHRCDHDLSPWQDSATTHSIGSALNATPGGSLRPLGGASHIRSCFASISTKRGGWSIELRVSGAAHPSPSLVTRSRCPHPTALQPIPSVQPCGFLARPRLMSHVPLPTGLPNSPLVGSSFNADVTPQPELFVGIDHPVMRILPSEPAGGPCREPLSSLDFRFRPWRAYPRLEASSHSLPLIGGDRNLPPSGI